MAITAAQTALLFSGAETFSLASGGTQKTDAQTIAANELDFNIIVKSVIAVAEAKAVDVYLYITYGDPANTGTNQYQTNETRKLMVSLDHTTLLTQTDDIKIDTTGAISMQLEFVNNATASVTISADGVLVAYA